MAKKTFAPVELTLYDVNDEPIKTYSKSVIRWGLMKQAIAIAKQVDGEDFSSADFDAMSAFVCRVFDDQFTPDELESGADIAEIINVLSSVVRRANAMGNA